MLTVLVYSLLGIRVIYLKVASTRSTIVQVYGKLTALQARREATPYLLRTMPQDSGQRWLEYPANQDRWPAGLGSAA